MGGLFIDILRQISHTFANNGGMHPHGCILGKFINFDNYSDYVGHFMGIFLLNLQIMGGGHPSTIFLENFQLFDNYSDNGGHLCGYFGCFSQIMGGMAITLIFIDNHLFIAYFQHRLTIIASIIMVLRCFLHTFPN